MNGLNLIAYERASSNDPKLKRRCKLLEKLTEQKRIAEDRSYQPTAFRWVDGEDGERKRIEVRKHVKQWWGKDASGNTVLTVRYGSKPLELAKGKQAIKLASDADVAKTLHMIAEAVEAGELDDAIAQQAGTAKLKTKAT